MRPGLTLSVALLLALPVAAVAADKPRVDFERDVLPLLKDRCFECHDGRKHKSGFRLDVRPRPQGRRVGQAGHRSRRQRQERADSSRHQHRRRGRHAAKGERLRPQIQTLRDWIDGGATWPDALASEDPRCATGPSGRRSARTAGRQGCELGAQSHRPLRPRPAGEGRTGARRRRPTASRSSAGCQLDLIGLPPTAEEVDAFLADRCAGRLREGGRAAAGVAALRRALGPALARRRPLRRQRRLREGQAALRLGLPRLGHQRLQPRPALRPLHHRAARRRPAAERRRRTSSSPPASCATR